MYLQQMTSNVKDVSDFLCFEHQWCNACCNS